MTSEKFSGKINLSKKPASTTELDDLMDAYLAYGFRRPPELTQSSFMAGVGGAFLTTEMPPTEMIPDLSPQSRNYFKNEVRPTLARQAEAGDTKALEVARKAGAFVSAYYLKHPEGIDGIKEFGIEDGVMNIDGITQPYSIETGWVVDYGIGLTGLINHIKGVRSERYGVIGLVKTQGEQAALRGLALHRGMSPDDMQIFAGGISSNVSGMLKNGSEGAADMVIASRVHMAGSELVSGVAMAPDLLRQEGLLVARGPRRYSAGADYDTLLRGVKNDRRMTVIADRTTARRTKHGTREDNRSFVARKK